MHNVCRKALALKFREAAPDWFRTALAKELNIPVSSLAGKAGNLVRLSVITNNLDNDIGTGKNPGDDRQARRSHRVRIMAI